MWPFKKTYRIVYTSSALYCRQSITTIQAYSLSDAIKRLQKEESFSHIDIKEIEEVK